MLLESAFIHVYQVKFKTRQAQVQDVFSCCKEQRASINHFFPVHFGSLCLKKFLSGKGGEVTIVLRPPPLMSRGTPKAER